jgi:hypothetical protein
VILDASEYVLAVRDALLARVPPPDPETVDQFDAAVAEFSEEAWRWEPAEKERVELLGGLPDPMNDDRQAELVSTILGSPAVFGPVVRMLAAPPGGSDDR